MDIISLLFFKIALFIKSLNNKSYLNALKTYSEINLMLNDLEDSCELSDYCFKAKQILRMISNDIKDDKI